MIKRHPPQCSKLIKGKYNLNRSNKIKRSILIGDKGMTYKSVTALDDLIKRAEAIRVRKYIIIYIYSDIWQGNKTKTRGWILIELSRNIDIHVCNYRLYKRRNTIKSLSLDLTPKGQKDRDTITSRIIKQAATAAAMNDSRESVRRRTHHLLCCIAI